MLERRVNRKKKQHSAQQDLTFSTYTLRLNNGDNIDSEDNIDSMEKIDSVDQLL
jgi:hypothetical protein